MLVRHKRARKELPYLYTRSFVGIQTLNYHNNRLDVNEIYDPFPKSTTWKKEKKKIRNDIPVARERERTNHRANGASEWVKTHLCQVT